MNQSRLLTNLAVVGCLLVLVCGWARAQEPVAQPLEVYSGETKLLPIEGFDSTSTYTVTPDNIVKIERAEDAPNQLDIIPLAGGTATLTVKAGVRTLIYDIAVIPTPERLYINLNESRQLSFPFSVDDYRLSLPGIVHVEQPDTSDKVLLVEALTAGKTTLTVESNKQIYRYFISTFENRGADILDIENAFSAKGYRGLTISFDKDQAIIAGTVPTQEELDDAVRIVKQFTQYVVVKAELGQVTLESDFTEQEAIIINNIQKIANVKGLNVRVKFPMPSVITTSTVTRETGDVQNPTTVTIGANGQEIRGGGGFAPPDAAQQQNPNAETEPKPRKGEMETVTTKTDTSVPEKIFLSGDVENDLDEARALRVARTFCPFIVNFMTVKDPIQLRTEIRFMQVRNESTKNTGFNWANGGTGPTITLGFGQSAFGLLPNPVTAFKNFITSPSAFDPVSGIIASGTAGQISANVVLNLFETEDVTKELRTAELFLTDGQPGWYSDGEEQSYVSNATTQVSATTPITTLTASFVFLGVHMDISPLNLPAAGGNTPTAEKILAIPTSLGTQSAANIEVNKDPSADPISRVPSAIQTGGTAPFIDSTTKYVDENGTIGLNIATQLTVPNGALDSPADRVLIDNGAQGYIDLPQFFVRTTRTRVNLRDGQTVLIDGLIDREVSKTINSVPFLSKIPFFSTFFKNHEDTDTNNEVMVLVTPHIIRMRDPNSARYPKPHLPEMQDMAREDGEVPIIPPVRYDVGSVDIRPAAPEGKGDVKPTEPPAPVPPAPLLTPHATGGMESLQPPPESAPAKVSEVDKASSAPDISRQPSSAPLAPSSTLP